MHPTTSAHHSNMSAHKVDANGHLIYKLGDNLTPRFKIMRTLGEGTFGKVLSCWDRHRSTKYSDAARDEIRILEDLKRRDPEDNKFVFSFYH